MGFWPNLKSPRTWWRLQGAPAPKAIAISPGLMEREAGINAHMAFVPEGVDSKEYMRECAEPRDIRSIPRPRIGYTGVLKRQLDWQLLRELARRHVDWSFVYVGPRSLAHSVTRRQFVTGGGRRA